ncbi:hypothetical protein [Paenibacillus hamazuiensis]|uniref:hypothetical protein n=1 Tax=Paenibacillus hamazuiensis TaxID=2936508 RepID=UPI00200C5F8E|nr:hypothetical protein [Paenibacillus hamazuiensis]
MLLRALFVLLFYTVILSADVRRLKKLGSREYAAYAALLLLSAYLGTSYVLDLNWPFLEDAAYAIFRETARSIVDSLKAPS